MHHNNFQFTINAVLNGFSDVRFMTDYESILMTFTDKSGGGAFSGTYQVQVSLDGTDYADFGTAFTTNGVLRMEHMAIKSVRVKTTVAPGAPTSVPTVRIAGLNHQTN